MKTLNIKDLKSGMIVAKPIVTKRGQTIAKAGTKLNDQLIARLSFYKIEKVSVEQDFSDENLAVPEVEIKEEPVIEKEVPKKEPKNDTIIESMSYKNRLQNGSAYKDFQLNYSRSMATLETTFDEIIFGDGAFSKHELIAEVDQLFARKTNIEVFDMLSCMNSVDDSVYAHSLNVALISRAIGKWLKMSKHELDELTIAGLLHDIGKTEIPDEVLNKQGKLSDEEFNLIKSHAMKGSKILKKANLDSDVVFAALQHHERSDGSGYPRGLESDEISDFAAIIAIADVYDAMTSARSYRAPKCAFQVIAAFEEEGLQKYNTKYILTFLARMANAYQNSTVILSDGRSGKIIYINKDRLSRPMVQIDEDNIVDLSREPSLTITSIV